MRLKKNIPDDELQRRKETGWSHHRLAIHFGVSISTIRRRLKVEKPAKDKDFMTFTQNLVKMANEAPHGYCRKELLRLVHSLRVRNAMSDERKAQIVMGSIATGARQLDEIAEECGFSPEETERILDQLLAENRIERRERGGVQNRGRRMKYHYFPVIVI